jgi:hypothetical protein
MGRLSAVTGAATRFEGLVGDMLVDLCRVDTEASFALCRSRVVVARAGEIWVD